MKKIFNFILERSKRTSLLISKNLLLILTLFLLAFIPLYPKLPIVDVTNTWVYIRVEDFIVAGVLTLWIFLVLLKKVKLKTPLTVPILIFWLVGAISTFHGVLILFPTLANVFSNVALLSFFRRIEYIALFFIAYTSIRDKRFIYPFISVLAITLVLIVLYGMGQRLLGFPAFLTGNEEFAKGIPLRISSLGRITSTFAGHYDLAAYLVLVIPIFASLAFAFKNILWKLTFLIIALLGFGLLFTTVSRISFFVLLLSLFTLLILQKKRFIIITLFALTVLFLFFSPSLITRFQNTVSEVNVLVNPATGAAISEVREVPREYFKDKLVLRNSAILKEAKTGTSSAIFPYINIPQKVQLLVQANVPTGEYLPQGTGYINLSLSPISKRVSTYFTEKIIEEAGKKTAKVYVFEGSFLVKKAKAYDLSFTTRFQGEWPKTIDAFRRNIFLGSGYGSVSLAVDNNYLRILGETGIFGLLSFFLIFLVAGIYIKKSFPKVDSPTVRNLVLGFIAGTFGLMLNAIFIDVFEASKIAFTYWLLLGVVLGFLKLYNPEDLNIFKEIKQVIASPYAVIFYIFLIVFGLFSPLLTNYFIGDDFTWLRWAADSKASIIDYFTKADGFFYRPGAKLYFSAMYGMFWFNQVFYHIVSVVLHFFVAFLFYIISLKILKNYALSVIGVVLFLLLSSYHEVIFWISATGFLFSALFSLLSLLSYIYWKEKKNNLFIALTLIFTFSSFLFHEIGVVSPFIIILYEAIFGESVANKLMKRIYFILLLPLLPYLTLRFLANSHWFSGDYSYNLFKLPLNFAGNTVGYFTLNLFGPQSLGFYEALRSILRGNIFVAVASLGAFLIIAAVLGKFLLTKLEKDERKIVVFGILFFVIGLLPFLGLGNIASRYGYLSSMGFVIIFPIFIKKAYHYLQSIGDKYTVPMITILVIMIFSSLHLFQWQKAHLDWRIAGEKVETFLISFEGIYKDYWVGKKIDFYFVDVPIKNGEAWIFPVGLKDALWFTFKNQNINVFQVESINSALFQNPDPMNSSIFKFDEYGRVQEITNRDVQN